MKKLIVMATMAVATAAHADIAINWQGSAGFYNWNQPLGSPADPAGYINFGGGSAIAYLLWSPDNARDAINAGNLGGGGVSGVVSQDQVLDSVVVNNAPYGDYSNGAEIYSGSFNGVAYDLGFVYLRIIDLSAPGGMLGQYFDSIIIDAALYNPAQPTLQNLDNNTNPGLVGNQMVAVPEPSTYAFMGIGALLLAIRRFRRS